MSLQVRVALVFALGYVLVLHGIMCAAVSQNTDEKAIKSSSAESVVVLQQQPDAKPDDEKAYKVNTPARMDDVELYTTEAEPDHEKGYRVDIPPRMDDIELYTTVSCRPEYGVYYRDTSKSSSGSWNPPKYGYMKISSVGTWEDCGRRCNSERYCTHWTWNHEGLFCLLNSHGHNIRHTVNSSGGFWISGRYNCFRSSGSV